MRDDGQRLQDILTAIDLIQEEAAKGKAAFDSDRLIRTWIVHHIQIIGEAASRLSDASRASAPGVPWPQVIAMRNLLVHEYFGIDQEEVWQTAVNDLPRLRSQVEAVLDAWNARG